MTQLVARLLLSMLLWPLCVFVYAVLCITSFELGLFRNARTQSYSFLFAGLLTWGFIAIYWTMLWRKHVVWNALRKARTVAVTCMAIVIGVAAALITGLWDGEMALFFGSVITPMGWLIGTILAWRETNAERAARVLGSSPDALVCPTCGYNLTGLSEARCPECGAKFTLSELLAAQPARVTEAADREMSKS